MISKSIVLSFLIVALASFSQSANLPDYIKACSTSDPKFNECALQSARASMRRFAKGDPERDIPALDPLRVKEIRALGKKGGDGLNVIFNDCKLTGCENLDLTKFKIDLDKKRIVGKANGNLVLDAKYDISGRILIIPLTGHGDAHVELRDCKFTYTFDFEYVNGKDGKEYLKILKDNLKYDIGKASFKLHNLFNGDKVLGDTTNRLLNDSWKEVINEVSPPVAETLKIAFRSAIQKFLDAVPVEELVLN